VACRLHFSGVMRAVLLVVLAVTGCMGQIGSPTPGGDDDNSDKTAKQIFTSEVYQVVAKCQGGACHATTATSSAMGHWYAGDANSTYTAITAATVTVGNFNAIAPIITKIDAGHQGISYTASERSSIVDWLSAEETERAGSGPPPVDPVALINTWSGCMTQENFDSAQMATLFGNSVAGNGQACKNCHTYGAEGFTVSPDSPQYLMTISTSQSQLLKYFSVRGNQVVLNMAAMTNAGTAIQGHPPFDASGLSGLPALQQFYDLTKTAQMAGCGPTKITMP
jgi:hypothetical protein